MFIGQEETCFFFSTFQILWIDSMTIVSRRERCLQWTKRHSVLQLGPFKILNELGTGQFGSVFSGIHEGTNEKVAIKQINKSKIEKERLLMSEINIHKKSKSS